MKKIIPTASSAIGKYSLRWDDEKKVAYFCSEEAGKENPVNRILYNSNKTVKKINCEYTVTYQTAEELFNQVSSTNPDSTTASATWVQPRQGAVKVVKLADRKYKFTFLNRDDNGRTYGRPFKSVIIVNGSPSDGENGSCTYEYYSYYDDENGVVSTTPQYPIEFITFLGGKNGNEMTNPLYWWNGATTSQWGASGYLPTTVGSQVTDYFYWTRYFRGDGTGITYIADPSNTSSSGLQSWDRYNTAKQEIINSYNNYGTSTTVYNKVKSAVEYPVNESDGTKIFTFKCLGSTLGLTFADSIKNHMVIIERYDSIEAITDSDLTADISDAACVTISYTFNSKLKHIKMYFWENDSSVTCHLVY